MTTAHGAGLPGVAPGQVKAIKMAPKIAYRNLFHDRMSLIVTLIGWKVAGAVGALTATLALYMPSFTLALMVSRVWERYRGRNWHTALQKGLTPIAGGLILAAILSVLQLTNSLVMVTIAFASFACFLVRPKLSPMYMLAAGGLVAIAVNQFVS